jgi:hypothetical protein
VYNISDILSTLLITFVGDYAVMRFLWILLAIAVVSTQYCIFCVPNVQLIYSRQNQINN